LSIYHLCIIPRFFFHDPPPPQIYTLSLHDALPISETARFLSARDANASDARGRASRTDGTRRARSRAGSRALRSAREPALLRARDRKSTRLNSSHDQISYAVFCLKKKTHTRIDILP